MSGHACSNGSRRQPFYKVGEVERICTDALTATGLMPTDPCPIRIERFVEKYFKVAPRYEMLPDNILGFTEFGRNGVKAIVVTSLLDEEGSQVAERRIRTTLAHEAGHGLLHLHLFAGAQKPSSLFDDNHDQPEILCRDVQGKLSLLSSPVTTNTIGPVSPHQKTLNVFEKKLSLIERRMVAKPSVWRTKQSFSIAKERVAVSRTTSDEADFYQATS